MNVLSINITTDRLLIKKLELNDRVEFFRYRSLPEVYKYQSFIPKNMNAIDDFISDIPSNPNIPNTWFQLAIVNKNEDMLIGDIGIHFLEDNAQVEVGYTLAPRYQGQGYAIEALKAVINYLFFELKKHRITASVDPNNTKSIRLLEKLGMRKEGHFIKSFKMGDVWLDDCIYAILKDEWKA
ncbi:GNAT family N-acetyltransferase [Clostridium estertheticum]|uniref:GNAT family N-acetyltransferase n=1 Tax=Clostridium estertheticum TaxID=238834 RepID=UPI0013E99035|nr:GNAT family protein [Clostridium estertheticum]MBZ9685860.1 GNAT family N-acetyltransferase [Clostridium estertheticum]